MSPSFLHEIRKRQLGRMIEILAEELDLEIVGGGSTTFRREDAKRGLEPDECYWLAMCWPSHSKRKSIWRPIRRRTWPLRSISPAAR